MVTFPTLLRHGFGDLKGCFHQTDFKVNNGHQEEYTFSIFALEV
jgi:hypothetical protein